ncbi:MAG: dihydroxyacetone kinase subunit DhaK [Nitrososphaeria archaeon]
MKKILNKPGEEVREMLEGLVMAFPELIELDPKYNNIYRKCKKKDRVAIITGGGSGHEPAYGGFVGYGMLDAAIAGAVFTSPSTMQIYQAMKTVATKKGVLSLIMNYTGDKINFKAAMKLAEDDGIKTELVISNDDVALKDKQMRRGTTITVLAQKIAGAAAEEGMEITEVKRIAQKVIDNGRDVGVALTPCSVPAAGKYSFELKEDEIEFGIGIHGEPGVQRIKYVPSAELAKIMVDKLVEDLNVKKGDEIIVVVQGTGGTPYMEKLVFYRDVMNYLNSLGLKTYASWVGEFLTSIEMQGARVAILKVDEEMKRLFSAQALTPVIKTVPMASTVMS